VFKFITRQHFLVNLLAAAALLFALVFAFLSMLNVITRHNQYEKVPPVANMTLKQAVDALEGKGFKVEVMDSVWDPKVEPLLVISQSPEAGKTVKAHRIIFLTVNKSQPPLVDMPNLVGFSFRNALLYMQQIGLILGDTTRKPDIARDAVLEQLYNGRPIKPGTRIFEGSTVSFVLGSGLGDEETEVPDLFGMTFSEARIMLQSMGLNLGAVIPDPDVKDTANGYIYRQNPEPVTLLPDGARQINRMRVGQSLDVWLSLVSRERTTPEVTDSTVADPDNIENEEDNRQ
jgi:eukaryotic-like serine/threonine-protein kinase